jgi:hypothetical protein
VFVCNTTTKLFLFAAFFGKTWGYVVVYQRADFTTSPVTDLPGKQEVTSAEKPRQNPALVTFRPIAVFLASGHQFERSLRRFWQEVTGSKSHAAVYTPR